jgi:hypothetical protein
VLAAADLNNGPYADAVSAQVATSETTTSTSYTDLATSGPAATVTLVAGQGCLVIVSARMSHSTGGSGNATYMSFAVSGAESASANDNDAVLSLASSNSEQTGSRVTWYVAGVTGTHTFTAKYKITNPGTGTFRERRIVVKKF